MNFKDITKEKVHLYNSYSIAIEEQNSLGVCGGGGGRKIYPDIRNKIFLNV